jgi:hypothetical protein
MAEHFFGYGKWDAPFWFIGTEAAMDNDGIDSITSRFQSWQRLGRANAAMRNTRCRLATEAMMDSFESIISTLLEADNYWVRRSFKVKVTREEKRQVGKHSIPRPEIDLLALRFSKNEVIAFEVKSFLDSPGVRLADLQKKHDVQEGMYKLFTSRNYREVVLARLKQDLIDQGMATSKTTVKLGLAAGKVYQRKSEPHMTQSMLIREYMEKNNFVFWSPEEIRSKIEVLAKPGSGYQNDPAIMTAKILTRGGIPSLV